MDIIRRVARSLSCSMQPLLWVPRSCVFCKGGNREHMQRGVLQRLTAYGGASLKRNLALVTPRRLFSSTSPRFTGLRMKGCALARVYIEMMAARLKRYSADQSPLSHLQLLSPASVATTSGLVPNAFLLAGSSPPLRAGSEWHPSMFGFPNRAFSTAVYLFLVTNNLYSQYRPAQNWNRAPRRSPNEAFNRGKRRFPSPEHRIL